MINNVFGGVNSDGVHTDISNSKRYATLNGYSKVSVCYNGGYVVSVIAERKNNKWVKC